MRKPPTYSGLAQMLDEQSKLYRRALWSNQAVDVEVWLEKDALLGVLYPVTSKWDVPLMVTRGYSSLSFAWGAAEALSQRTWPTHIYNLGDHDPRGRNISESLERTLREMAPDADFTFTRLALNEDQVVDMGLSTRPTKTTDSLSKTFKGESAELDAVPPPVLREIVETAITSHIDHDALDFQRSEEALERDLLGRLPKAWVR